MTALHLTQLERARIAYACALANPLDRQAVDELRRALEDAQSPPPEGGSDGSVGALLWPVLNRALTALSMLQHAHEAMAEIKRDPAAAQLRQDRAQRRRRDEDWG